MSNQKHRLQTEIEGRCIEKSRFCSAIPWKRPFYWRFRGFEIRPDFPKWFSDSFEMVSCHTALYDVDCLLLSFLLGSWEDLKRMTTCKPRSRLLHKTHCFQGEVMYTTPPPPYLARRHFWGEAGGYILKPPLLQALCTPPPLWCTPHA